MNSGKHFPPRDHKFNKRVSKSPRSFENPSFTESVTKRIGGKKLLLRAVARSTSQELGVPKYVLLYRRKPDSNMDDQKALSVSSFRQFINKII